MCHERWWRRREREAEESRAIWTEFEQTRPIADPEPADEPATSLEETPAEEVAAPER